MDLDSLERELLNQLDRWKNKMLLKIQHDVEAIQEQIHLRIDNLKDKPTTHWDSYSSSIKMELVIEAMKRHGDNKTHAAKSLGLSRAGLHYWLEKINKKGQKLVLVKAKHCKVSDLKAGDA